MFKNEIDIRLKYEKFIKKVCETNIVYALKSEYGFATSKSNNFEDEDSEPIVMICFWSEKELANSCAINEWKEYELTEINLVEFIESWCIGMANDGLLIGINFDQSLFGFEIEPLEIVLIFINELRNNKIELKFRNYKNIEDLEIELKKEKKWNKI